MFKLKFKADTKKIVTIDEYFDLPLRESKKCMVQPKSKDELIEVVKKAIAELGEKADLNFIDTFHITDMGWLFSDFKYNVKKFNGDISKWDVSNVEDMSYMFYDAKFNGDISNWKISENCENDGMFG